MSLQNRLNEKQLAAIEYLAVPKRGGMSYEEIAEAVGVTDRTLRNWRNDDRFNEALKRRIVENTTERLPELFDAAFEGVIDDKNAAMFRTLLQAHGLLTDKVEVNKTESMTGRSIRRHCGPSCERCNEKIAKHRRKWTIIDDM